MLRRGHTPDKFICVTVSDYVCIDHVFMPARLPARVQFLLMLVTLFQTIEYFWKMLVTLFFLNRKIKPFVFQNNVTFKKCF